MEAFVELQDFANQFAKYRLSIDNLKSEISSLSQKVMKISQQVLMADKDIKRQMEDFLKLAAAETTALQKEIDELDKVRMEMAEFLCEDLQSFKLEECFKVFQAFCVKFKSAVEENANRRQQERRAEARRRQREEQLTLKKKHQIENRPPSYSGSESDNIIDMLLYEINGSISKSPFNDPNFNKGGQRKTRQIKSQDSSSELSRMNSLTSSLPSEEEVSTCSPRVIRRRIGSLNSVATNCESGDVESPDITPNGTLIRKRNRLSSDDHEDNGLLDYLRQSSEIDSPSKLSNDKLGKSLGSDVGSLDRSILRRSSRRRRADILASELNERERPASPLASPVVKRKADLSDLETNKPKPWRKKIEDWLSESEKEQQRERGFKEKFNLGKSKQLNQESRESNTSVPTSECREEEHKSLNKNLETLHEAKTDSELYSGKLKTALATDNFPNIINATVESTQLKDKSKWRKSTLNVANSSESIDDERRRNRSRKSLIDLDSGTDDTITLYLRASDSGNKEKRENQISLRSEIGKESDSAIQSTRQIKEICQNDKACEEEQKSRILLPQLNNYEDTDNILITGNRKKAAPSSGTQHNAENPDSFTYIKRNRLYQSMKEPSGKTEKIIKMETQSDEESSDKSFVKSTCNSNSLNAEKQSQEKPATDIGEEGNFDRFSFMRKTRRRTKSRQKLHENEPQIEKTAQDHIQETNSNPFIHEHNSTSDTLENNPSTLILSEIEGAIKHIDKASQEIRNLKDSNLTCSNLSLKDKSAIIPDFNKKDKPSLKTRFSNKLLSLTGNQPGKNTEKFEKPNSEISNKNIDFTNTVPSSETYDSQKSNTLYKEQPVFERLPSLVNNEDLPIMQHREKVLFGPRNILKSSPNRNSSEVVHNWQPISVNKNMVGEQKSASIPELENIHCSRKRIEPDRITNGEGTRSEDLDISLQSDFTNYSIDSTDSPQISQQLKNEFQLLDETNDGLPSGCSVQCQINLEKKNDKVENLNVKPDCFNAKVKKQDTETQTLKPTSVEGTMPSSKKKEVTPLKTNETPFFRELPSVNKSDNRSKRIAGANIRNIGVQPTILSNSKLHKSPILSRKESSKPSMNNSRSFVPKQSFSKRKDGIKTNQNSVIHNEPIGQRVAAYTKAIRSMTNNLRKSNKGLENYDTTQSMPPTPSEENKTLASVLIPNGVLRKSKKTNSSSAINVLKSKLQPSPSSTPVGSRSGSRRSSERSLDRLSRKSSEKSLNLSRKSSETSIATVKYVSKNYGNTLKPASDRKRHTLTNPISKIHGKTSTRTVPVVNDNRNTNMRMKNANNRNQKDDKQISKEKLCPEPITPIAKPRSVVRRSSSDGNGCSFMKATSSSSAKVALQPKVGGQRNRGKSLLTTNTFKNDNLLNKLSDQ